MGGGGGNPPPNARAASSGGRGAYHALVVSLGRSEVASSVDSHRGCVERARIAVQAGRCRARAPAAAGGERHCTGAGGGGGMEWMEMQPGLPAVKTALGLIKLPLHANVMFVCSMTSQTALGNWPGAASSP